LQGANLSETKLIEADLTGAFLENAELRQTDLSEANLTKADLRGASLNETKLLRANLTGANLTGAQLVSVILNETNLTDANLSNASIYGRLKGATLSRVQFKGANLAGVLDLREIDLRVVIYDKATRWPTGYEPPKPQR
jgi:uncharacterized protein YjbI with pentapeptide repeats